MRLVSFEIPSPVGPLRRLGALLERTEASPIVDLRAAFGAYLVSETREPTPRQFADLRMPPDMIGWLRAGHEGFSAASNALAFMERNPTTLGVDGERTIYQRDEVKLLAAVPEPLSFYGYSTYLDHMTRADPPWQKKPAYYKSPPYYTGSPRSVKGPEDPVTWPYYTKRLDLELEIGIVVGREGRNLSQAEAHEYIAGYTIIIDSSARDGYDREPFGPNKRKSFHTGMGAWLVTPEEVDLSDLQCKIEVDGEVWFEGSTGAPRSFTPADIVAYASDNETIRPGDVYATGTISYACSMDHHHWLKIGQVATFSIEQLGSMSLKVVEGEHVVDHVNGMAGLCEAP